jgi:hypothetical protein
LNFLNLVSPGWKIDNQVLPELEVPAVPVPKPVTRVLQLMHKTVKRYLEVVCY